MHGNGKATAQKTKTIKAIGKFLAALPNARELYKGHVWTEEAEAAGPDIMGCWDEEEEDVFGHAAAGLHEDDPDAHMRQGLRGKEEMAELQQQEIPDPQGHDWVWSGRAWQCFAV